MFNLRKLIIGIIIVLVVLGIISFSFQQKNQVVIPDISNDKDAKEASRHILSANPWFTCPDENKLADWIRNFDEKNHLSHLSKDQYYTKEYDEKLFIDNPLYLSCLLVNGKDYLNKLQK